MKVFLRNFILVTMLFGSYSHISNADMPITTDSRIKTVLYNQSDVFRLVIHYGYQTVIELSQNEQVQNIAIGDNFAWKINVIGNRLFVKPLQDNINTNMTLITNYRTYYFDLFASKPTENIEEFTYVMRFFYPEGTDK